MTSRRWPILLAVARYQLRLVQWRWYAIGVALVLAACHAHLGTTQDRWIIASLCACFGMILPSATSIGSTAALRVLPVPEGYLGCVRWVVLLALAELCALPLIASDALSVDGSWISMQDRAAIACWPPLACVVLLLLQSVLRAYPWAILAIFLLAPNALWLMPSIAGLRFNLSASAVIGSCAIFVGVGWCASVEPRLETEPWSSGRVAGRIPIVAGLLSGANRPSSGEAVHRPPQRRRFVLLTGLQLRILMCSRWLWLSMFLTAMYAYFAYDMLSVDASAVLCLGGYMALLPGHLTRDLLFGGRFSPQRAFVTTLLAGPVLVSLMLLAAVVYHVPQQFSTSIYVDLSGDPRWYLLDAIGTAPQVRSSDGQVVSREDYLAGLPSDHGGITEAMLRAQFQRLIARKKHLWITDDDMHWCPPVSREAAARGEGEIRSGEDSVSPHDHALVELRASALARIEPRQEEECLLMIFMMVVIAMLSWAMFMPGRSSREGSRVVWMRLAFPLFIGYVFFETYQLKAHMSVGAVPALNRLPAIEVPWWDWTMLWCDEHARVLVGALSPLAIAALAIAFRRVRYLPVLATQPARLTSSG